MLISSSNRIEIANQPERTPGAVPLEAHERQLDFHQAPGVCDRREDCLLPVYPLG